MSRASITPHTTSGYIPFRSYQTFYKVWGTDPRELSKGKGNDTSDLPPLIILHGGPGAPHDLMLTYADLMRSGGTGKSRTVILYDQVGCGQSTLLPEKKGDNTFWTVQFFLEELDNLLGFFGLGGGEGGREYDIGGASWGGMLASEHASRQPKGLRRLIISSSPASMQDWVNQTMIYRKEIPTEVSETLDKHEKEGTTDSKEYEEATAKFYAKHVCRLDPMPEILADCFEAMKKDNSVYVTMNGPNEFSNTGNLRTWSIKGRAQNITARTLITHGKYDCASNEVIKPWLEEIRDVKVVRFEESSHIGHIEERERFMESVDKFLCEE